MGIDLNQPISFKHASWRFFDKNEHHVTRLCPCNVLLLVYEGVLRFSENGTEREVRAGEYYIQQKNSYQDGALASDAPHYFYVHFDGEWTNADDPNALSRTGTFDTVALTDLTNRMDNAAHGAAPYNELQYLFLKLLLSLRTQPHTSAIAAGLAEYVERNIENITSLTQLCKELNYSKNYVIRIFNKEFGMSPFQYVNEIRLKRAMYLLETTSRPIDEVAHACGYADYAYFYKRFVKKTGLAPLKWRKKMQRDPLFE